MFLCLHLWSCMTFCYRSAVAMAVFFSNCSTVQPSFVQDMLHTPQGQDARSAIFGDHGDHPEYTTHWEVSFLEAMADSEMRISRGRSLKRRFEDLFECDRRVAWKTSRVESTGKDHSGQRRAQTETLKTFDQTMNDEFSGITLYLGLADWVCFCTYV